jgi:hypothetical protein
MGCVFTNATVIDDLLRKAAGSTADTGEVWPSGEDSLSGKPHIAIATGGWLSISHQLGKADCFYCGLTFYMKTIDIVLYL